MLEIRKAGTWAATAFAAIFCWQSAVQGATLVAVADTYLSPGLPDTSFGGSNLSVGNATAPALVQFDLTGFAGLVVNSPPILRLYFRSSGAGDTQGDVELTVYRTLVGWDETTTYNTFGPSPGATPGVDFDSTFVGVFPLTFVRTQQAMDISVPASVLQGWIDNPGTNFGFLLAGNGPTVFSRESVLPPQLIFGAGPPEDEEPVPGGVPEPQTWAMLAGGLATVGLLRVRQK